MLRADYDAQRERARAGQGSGPGWIETSMGTDEGGSNVLVAAPDGALIASDQGRAWYFDDAAFIAHYRSRSPRAP